jgi:hypothetical protein
MANSTRMSMQKRQREQKRAEKAELKREQKRKQKLERTPERGAEIASADELAKYGAAPAPFSTLREE